MKLLKMLLARAFVFLLLTLGEYQSTVSKSCCREDGVNALEGNLGSEKIVT